MKTKDLTQNFLFKLLPVFLTFGLANCSKKDLGETSAFSTSNAEVAFHDIEEIEAGLEELSPKCELVDEPNNEGLCPTEISVDVDNLDYHCTDQKYTLKKHTEEFIVLDSNYDVIWPGSILTVRDEAPVHVAERVGGDITMTLATQSEGSFTRYLENPSLASYTDGLTSLLNENTDISTPAKFNYRMESIHSKEQLKLKFGFGGVAGGLIPSPFAIFGGGVAAGIATEKNHVTNKVVLEFTQEYFSIAFSPKGNKFFSDDANLEAMLTHSTPENPMGYISGVKYGRKIYVVLESTASHKDIKGALGLAMGGLFSGVVGGALGGAAKKKYEKILNESSITMHVVGGDAQKALDSIKSQNEDGSFSINFEALIKEGANFSEGVAAVPISYSIRSLKSSKTYRTASATEYIDRKCSPGKAGGYDNLQITLDRVEIRKAVGSSCDREEYKTEFGIDSLPVADSDEDREYGYQSIWKSSAPWTAGPGTTKTYGLDNHKAVIQIPIEADSSFTIKGKVRTKRTYRSGFLGLEKETKWEKNLDFENEFVLEGDGTWLNWSDELIVNSDEFDGCKATLYYKLEWVYP